MASRPWVDFQEAKSKLTFEDVFRAFGIADNFVRRGDNWRGSCPLPQHRHNPVRANDQQFVVNRKRGVEYELYRCFGDCASQPWGGGDVVTFIRAMLGWCEESHVRLWLAETFPERLTSKRPRRETTAKEKSGEGPGQEGHSPPHAIANDSVLEAQADLKPLRFSLRLDLEAGLPYLQSRGIERATAERYGCGMCGRGMFAGYCCFPLFRWPLESPDEHPCGYIGRLPKADPPPDQPRYKLPPDFPKLRVMFGIQQALAIDSRWVVIVEGPIPAMLLTQLGIPAVATLGSSLSDEQAGLLLSFGRGVALCFDGDDAGRRGMRAAAGKLITGSWTHVVRLPDGAQPDTIPLDQLRTLLSSL